MNPLHSRIGLSFNLAFAGFYMAILFSFLAGQGMANNEEDLSPARIKVNPNQISTSGKRRLQEHLSIIEENLKNTQTNLTSTKKNIGVIEAEIFELDELEKEHLGLKKRYVDYLNHAAQEMEKNNKAMNDLQNFEKKAADIAKSGKGVDQKTQLEIGQREKLEREKWKTEAQAKIERVNELLKGITKNLNSINSRREPLRGQLRTWNDRKSDYENTLRKLAQKKTDDERLLASLKN